MRKNSPLNDELWDLSYVQVGSVKCPIEEQGHVNENKKLQGQQVSQRKAEVQTIYGQQGPRQGHNQACFVSNTYCDVNIGWKGRKKVTFGRIKGNQTEHRSNSWDKNFLVGGEYDTGASRRATDPRTKEDQMSSNGVNLNILWPIMAYYNVENNKFYKTPKGHHIM